ncbi:MAG TPA: HAMP domain-containing sensor histidine kinase [Thermoanaerobaculia bacterium]
MNGPFITRMIGSWSRRHPYIASLIITAAVTAVAFALYPVLQAANLDTLYLIAILVIALRWGQGPAVFTALLSGLLFEYCFIPPRFTYVISDMAYFVTAGGFLVVAIVTSRLAAHSRALIIEQTARERAEALAEAKDVVLHRVAHELRAPLTAVVGWAQLLRSFELDREAFDRALEGVDNSAAVLRELVNDLWDASRAASGKLPVRLKQIALERTVAKALDVVIGAAEQKGVELESELQSTAEILGDELRVKQIVTNLVSNAIKFTPAGGTVTVRLSRTDKHAELVVKDTGEGIPAEFLPHLFDAFTQADPNHAHTGLGLGLSIVKYLVEAHHGSISAVSDGPQRGSTFTVCLPLFQVAQPSDSSLVAAPAA